jgi:uncharacterized protein (DUF2252 family)
LREDHQYRIHDRSEEAAAKFDKLAGSLFSFFRGTALLFYRDMAGEDAWMPTVLTLGDVHPENFGVMPSADNSPIFGVNDFDEAYYAPFTWDLKRGATGFLVAAKEEGVGRKKRRKIARKLVRGYLDGVEDFARQASEVDHQMRIDNSPELIRDLLEDAREDRAEWLTDYVGDKRRRFAADDEIVPVTSRVDEFAEVVARYAADHVHDLPERAGDLTLKDVAERKGAGTASLGLPRYYLLFEGPSRDGRDDFVLEMKQARRSALAGLVPPSGYERRGHADRVLNAQMVQLVGGDPFYGTVEFGGASFLVRERSPFKDDIDLDDLSKSQWRTYAKVCGRALAQAHALADDSGDIEHDIEPQILDAVGDRALFVDDIVRYAEEAAVRLERDHEHFRRDHALGAFRIVDRVYR